MKLLNDKYREVFYEGEYWRFYDERIIDSYTAFYSETQIKLIELIEKFNLKIFYITCEHKINLPITFTKINCVDLNNAEVMTIKKLKKEDIYFLYKNQMFEIIYIIPKLTIKNFYYFDFLIVVDEFFNINKLYKHNFNLINIKSINQVNPIDITYNWIKKILSNRNIFYNHYHILDKDHINDYFDIHKNNLSYDEFSKNYTGGQKNKLTKYHNASSPIFHKNFNQNHYAKNCFLLLDMQILNFGKVFIKEENDFGFQISYTDIYNINSSFLTNFGELIKGININKENNKINTYKQLFTPTSILDSIVEQFINFEYLNKNSVLTGFADLSNLKTFNEKNTY